VPVLVTGLDTVPGFCPNKTNSVKGSCQRVDMIQSKEVVVEEIVHAGREITAQPHDASSMHNGLSCLPPIATCCSLACPEPKDMSTESRFRGC
jgi:hypothetical protein